MQIVHGKAVRQQPGVFDFEPVIEQRDTHGGAALGVVRMRHGVDQGLTNGHRR